MCTTGSGEVPSFAVDYAAVFRAFAGPALLLTPGLVVVDANQAFLDTCGRLREELVGYSVFDVFPQDPMAPGNRLRASVERVLATHEPDTMAVHRYDLPVPGRRPERSEERYWSSVTAPVLGPDGQVLLIISQVKDVTGLVRARVALDNGETLSGEETMTAALVARSRELQERNESLRRAHERESEIAMSLQRAMLPDTARERSNVAVRYRPATSALHVCGDWYDFLELGPGWLAVAVGDVVGHGLTAAGIMGQLRSALSTAMHATGQPARALKALAHYAVTVEGALATTAVQTVIDETTHTITYSRAGHPHPFCSTPTDMSSKSLTKRPICPWERWSLKWPGPSPHFPTGPVPPACSTPTDSSNAATRTSTPDWPASCRASLGTAISARNPWPTLSSPTAHHIRTAWTTTSPSSLSSSEVSWFSVG